MDKQVNHDKLHDESKTRTHRMSKLHDDGDPWAPNNLLLTYPLPNNAPQSLALINKAVSENMFEFNCHSYVYSPCAGADNPFGLSFHKHKYSVHLHTPSKSPYLVKFIISNFPHSSAMAT